MSVHCVDMDRKDRTLNIRVSEQQRRTYEQAATAEGTSVSAFVTGAADDRAERVLRAQRELTLAPDEFDALLALLDQPPAVAPALQRARRRRAYDNR